MVGSQIVTIDKFLGLNEDIAGDTQLKMGESPNMNNFRITELGKLMKRDGYKPLFSSIGVHDISGMWQGTINGVSTLVFSARNRKVYSIANPQLVSTNTPVDILGTGNLLSNTNDVSFFFMNNKLYLMNGQDYMVWTGTGNFVAVDPYVPLIKTACKPDGTGTDYESLNILTNKRYQVYNGDGTSTVYYLAEKNLDSIYAVYVFNGTTWVSTFVTKDLVNGTITFSTAPPDASLNVKVYYTKGTVNDLEITTQRYATVFSKELQTKVFVYGSTNSTIRKNRVYHSGFRVDTQEWVAEYFPALNFLDVGDTQYPVTGLISQYDRLIVSKTRDTYYITMTTNSEYLTATGSAVVTVSVSKLNDTIGNVAPNQLQLIQNNPFVVSNGIYEFTNTNVKDERNARYMSKRVNRTLESSNLTTAVTADFEYLKEYWVSVGTNVWVYNYAWDVWYKFTLTNAPTKFLQFGDTLLFGTSDGRIMYFEEGGLTDNQTAITSHWESGFMDFGSSWQRKYLNRMWISTKPGQPTDIRIGWLTDGNAAQQTTDIYLQSLFNFGDVNFGDFTFDISDNPKPKLLKIKAKKFVYFKLLIDSNDLAATVLAINLSIQKGGASK